MTQDEELEFAVILDNRSYRLLSLTYKSKREFLAGFVQVSMCEKHTDFRTYFTRALFPANLAVFVSSMSTLG